MPQRTFNIGHAQTVVRDLRRAFKNANLGEERAIEEGLVLAFNAIGALEDRVEQLENVRLELLLRERPATPH